MRSAISPAIANRPPGNDWPLVTASCRPAIDAHNANSVTKAAPVDLPEVTAWDNAGVVDQNVDVRKIASEGLGASGRGQIDRLQNDIDTVSFADSRSERPQTLRVARNEHEVCPLLRETSGDSGTDPLRCA